MHKKSTYLNSVLSKKLGKFPIPHTWKGTPTLEKAHIGEGYLSPWWQLANILHNIINTSKCGKHKKQQSQIRQISECISSLLWSKITNVCCRRLLWAQTFSNSLLWSLVIKYFCWDCAQWYATPGDKCPPPLPPFWHCLVLLVLCVQTSIMYCQWNMVNLKC